MQAEARMTEEGQVTIPEEIRQALDARPGDRLIFEADEQGVRIRVRQPVSFRKYVGIFREGNGKSVDEIVAEIREMRGE